MASWVLVCLALCLLVFLLDSASLMEVENHRSGQWRMPVGALDDLILHWLAAMLSSRPFRVTRSVAVLQGLLA